MLKLKRRFLTFVAGDISPGYFAAGGASTSTPAAGSCGDYSCGPCTPGHYCVGGMGVEENCPTGTYMPNNTATSISECLQCTPGHYCDGTGKNSTTGECTAGWYCTGNATIPNPEGDGTGNICPKGHECPTGSSSPSRCQGGYFANSTGQASCDSCPAGYYCETGAETPTPCPLGYFCPNNTESMKPCPSGTYNNQTLAPSSDYCVSCPPGISIS